MIVYLLQRIMPIPIPINTGHSNISNNGMLALYISVNIVCVFIFLIRALIYVIKKPEYETFYSFTMNPSDQNSFVGDFLIPLNSVLFLINNGLAIFLLLVAYVKSLI